MLNGGNTSTLIKTLTFIIHDSSFYSQYLIIDSSKVLSILTFGIDNNQLYFRTPKVALYRRVAEVFH